MLHDIINIFYVALFSPQSIQTVWSVFGFCFVIGCWRGPRRSRKTGSPTLPHPPKILLWPGPYSRWAKSRPHLNPSFLTVIIRAKGHLHAVVFFCSFLQEHREGNKWSSWKVTSSKVLPQKPNTPTPPVLIPCSPPPIHHPRSHSPTPLPLLSFIFWALSLTAGSDYGCEKWGSHASNSPPPAFLQHDSALSPYWCEACLCLPPTASLCLSSAVFISFLLFFPDSVLYRCCKEGPYVFCEWLTAFLSTVFQGASSAEKGGRFEAEREDWNNVEAIHMAETDGRVIEETVHSFFTDGAQFSNTTSPHKNKHTPSLPRAPTFMVHYMTV